LSGADRLEFWESLDRLVGESRIEIDRPRGSRHPRYPDMIYPLDYGYLSGTRSGDGQGIDVWLGSVGGMRVTGLLCTVDRQKRDCEMKLLVACTPHECAVILDVHNSGLQSAWLVRRDARDPPPASRKE
jgi:inorganic pyrophosphatase